MSYFFSSSKTKELQQQVQELQQQLRVANVKIQELTTQNTELRNTMQTQYVSKANVATYANTQLQNTLSQYGSQVRTLTQQLEKCNSTKSTSAFDQCEDSRKKLLVEYERLKNKYEPITPSATSSSNSSSYADARYADAAQTAQQLYYGGPSGGRRKKSKKAKSLIGL